MDEDLLVNTRKRRANAGSRLKQLLSAESADIEEDDVDLLFVEDEDDGEYNSGAEDDDEEEEDSEQSDDNEGAQDDSNVKLKKKSQRKLSVGADDEVGEEIDGEVDGEEVKDEQQETDSNDEEQRPLNDDEMFSDSSDDSSSEDSDVGEKELQKAERIKQRELKKKSKKNQFAPKIKKFTTPSITTTTSSTRRPKKTYAAPKADTLLSEHRRSSSRRAAVQSKLDLVEKLKEEEHRRSTLKPVQKVEYIEMTQEERLAEALETEKYNISTLNKYQEQENDRAVKRRELMMSKRRKLTDVMTIRTCVKYVEIDEERELEKFHLTRDVLKKKDRRGRKSEKQRKEEEEERLQEQRMRERWEMLNNPHKSYYEITREFEEQENENAQTESTTPAQDTPKQEQTPIEEQPSTVDTPKIQDNQQQIKKENVDSDDDIDTELITQEEFEQKKKETEVNEEEKKTGDKQQGKVKDQDNQHGQLEEDTKDEILKANGESLTVKEDVIDVSSDSDAEEEKEETPFTDSQFHDASDSIPNDDQVIKKEKPEEQVERPEEHKKEEEQEDKVVSTERDEDVPMIDAEQSLTTEATETELTTKELKDENKEGDIDVEMKDASLDIPTESATLEVSKTVTFADVPNQENMEEKYEEKKDETKIGDNGEDATEAKIDAPTPRPVIVTKPTPPPPPPKIIYEGPKQKVGVNYISFEHNYTLPKLRSLLLGKQANSPAFRRSLEVEPLVRIRQDPSTSSTSLDPKASLKLPDLSIMESFPEFGNFEKVHREITTVEAVKDTKIVLKTEAPTGIYLPSGQRKMCLITGKPAMYFDPKTGMPYADVESYKVIKEIQEGVFKWSEGGYVSNYHAKGVPPGFDKF